MTDDAVSPVAPTGTADASPDDESKRLAQLRADEEQRRQQHDAQRRRVAGWLREAAAGPAAAYLWLVAATGNGNHAYFLGLAHCLAASVLATKALAWHVPRRRALAA